MHNDPCRQIAAEVYTHNSPSLSTMISPATYHSNVLIFQLVGRQGIYRQAFDSSSDLVVECLQMCRQVKLDKLEVLLYYYY